MRQSDTDMTTTDGLHPGTAWHRRIAIIGAGFSGLGMAIRLKQEGIEDFVVLERANEVGGTWRDNTYPGCQCDIPSYLYSFSFAPNPNWTRSYPLQAEIREYLQRCAEEFGVMPQIRFGHELQDASWDEAVRCWRLKTSQGVLSADILVAGVGGLSAPSTPDIPGLERFEGTVFHSSAWDHEHDLDGERVAVIGTGASTIQFVPRIQPSVGALHLFQRTPPWVLPDRDRPIAEGERRLFRTVPPLQRLARAALYWAHEATVFVTIVDRRLAKLLERQGRRHLRLQVQDAMLRAKLTPSYTVGCKRILLSNEYYPALTRPNVELVTDPIREVRARSIVTRSGAEREVDTIILGTGFKVHDHPAFARVRGRDRRTLAEEWQGSPRAYLGTTVPGFPNLFLLVGPNSAGGFNSIVFTSEAHINYVMGCLDKMDDEGLESVEVRRGVYEAYNRSVDNRLRESVWNAGGCQSWYLDANGRNNVWWPGFTWRLWQRTRHFDVDRYSVRTRGMGAARTDGGPTPVHSPAPR
jgi:cation diffusion facilitator CzcD-associated flavoprotein CzcO